MTYFIVLLIQSQKMWTPLIGAASLGQVASVLFLTAAGAELDKQAEVNAH